MAATLRWAARRSAWQLAEIFQPRRYLVASLQERTLTWIYSLLLHGYDIHPRKDSYGVC